MQVQYIYVSIILLSLGLLCRQIFSSVSDNVELLCSVGLARCCSICQFFRFSNFISFSQINGLCWIYQNLYDVQFQTLLHPSSCRSFQILQLVVKKCSSFTFQCSYKFESESFLDIPSLINHHYLQSIPLTQTSGAILHTPITMVEEFLHSNIHLRVKLGSGNFGDVYQGEILHNKQEVNA